MKVRIAEIGEAIDRAVVDGVGRATDVFDAANLAGAVSSYAWDAEWQGTDARVLRAESLNLLSDDMHIAMNGLQQAAHKRGFMDWQANYVMLKTSTYGIGPHYDLTNFRHFSFFMAVQGRNEFYAEQTDGRYRGMILAPGDLLVMRQSTNVLDETTRVKHALRESGLRTLVNVSYVQRRPSYFPVGSSAKAA